MLVYLDKLVTVKPLVDVIFSVFVYFVQIVLVKVVFPDPDIPIKTQPVYPWALL